MQKINLYRHMPKLEHTPLHTKMMLTLYSLFFAILMLVFLGNIIYKHHLKSNLIIVKNQLENAQQQVTELSLKYNKLNVSTQLLENKLTVPCQVKFSAYLEAFAHAIPAGVWISNFTLSANGSQVLIKGNAIKASLVEEFLARLNKDPEFLSKMFEIQEVSQMNATADSTAQYLGFTLITKV